MRHLVLLILGLLTKPVFGQIADGLPDPPYRLLFSNQLKEASPVLAFNGEFVGVADRSTIFTVNVATGEKKNLRFDGTGIDPDSALPILVRDSGLYVASGDRVFFLSSDAPIQIWRASGRIRWVERKGTEAVLISKSGEIAILMDGKVSVIERSLTADASAVHGGIEIRDTTSAGSWLKLYSHGQLRASCTIPGVKLFRSSLSQDGARAYGLLSAKGNDIYEKMAAFDCASGRQLFQRSIFSDLLSGPKTKGHDYSRLMQLSAFGTVNACGEHVCANLITQEAAMEVQGISGIYCVDQKSGELSWQYGVPIARSTQRVSSAICRGNRLLTFQNFPPFIATRTFPSLIEQLVSLVDESAGDVLRSLVRPDAFIANPAIRPVIANGRLAFLDSEDHLFVFGK